MSSELGEVHGLPPEAFREQVRSFQFWFDAVQGYLEGQEYGHRDHPEAPALDEDERERLITVLCNYCVGETAALEGAGGLIRLAPNREAKVFLSTQTVDEGRHLEVLTHRMRELGVDDVEAAIARRANPSLVRFKQRLLDLIERGHWTSAVFAQNVVLEAMEFAVFRRHAQVADPITAEVLAGIVKDERRHIGFGENTLGRALRDAPAVGLELRALRRELDSLVLTSLEHTLSDLHASTQEKTDLSRDYLQAVTRLGFA